MRRNIGPIPIIEMADRKGVYLPPSELLRLHIDSEDGVSESRGCVISIEKIRM